jgi:hypothetical protein
MFMKIDANICIIYIYIYVYMNAYNIGFTSETASNFRANQIKITKPISTRRTNQLPNNKNEVNENRTFECSFMHYYHKGAEFLPLL